MREWRGSGEALKFMHSRDEYCSHRGCMRCLNFEYSHALRDKPGTVCVQVPASTCAPCDLKGRTFATRISDWFESTWASCCVVGSRVEMIELVLSMDVLKKMTEYLFNVAVSNDANPIPTLVFRTKEAVDAYIKLSGSCPHCSLYAFEWHVMAAYTRITNPARFKILSSTVPRTIEDVPVIVMPQAVTPVDPNLCAGAPLFGYTLSEDSWRDLPLSAEVKEFVKAFDEIHPADEKRVVALRQHMELLLATDGGGFGSRDQLIAEGKLRPQGTFLLPGRRENPVYAAAPTLDNLRAALRMRHFPPRVRPEVEALNKLAACQEVFLDYIRKAGKDEAIRQKNEQIFAQYNFDPRYSASKSWTTARIERAIHDLVYKSQPRIDRDKKGVMRKVHVKPNETLQKMKPRLIISAGDEGTFLQAQLPGLLEQLVFSLPRFKMMSVKSASPADFVLRMRTMFNEKRDWFAMSCDYGAFDSCVNQSIRDRVEKPILDWLVDTFTTIYTRAAQLDRKDELKRVSHPELRLLITDMIRESGDRGTSILNFVTNWVVFLYACYRHCEEHGLSSEPQIRSVLSGILDRRAQALHPGQPTCSADLAGEGDDSHQWFSPAFINGCFDGRVVPPPNAEALAAFTTRWVGYMKEIGFNLEPQNAMGRCTEGAMQPALGRHEFVSKLLVPYAHEKRLGVAVIPKIRKFFDSFCISFQVGRDWRIILAEKALSLMAGAVDSPLLFGAAATAFRNAREWTGSTLSCTQRDFESLRKHLGDFKYTGFVQSLVGLEEVNFEFPCPDAYDKLCAKHEALLQDGENAPKHKAVFDRTVGELVDEQPGSVSYGLKFAEKARLVRKWSIFFSGRPRLSEENFLQEWQVMRSNL